MSLNSPEPHVIHGSKFRVAIVAARFNQSLVDALLRNAVATLKASSVAAENIRVVRVPGSSEIPVAAKMLSEIGFDAIITLGVVIAGDTDHHDVIARMTSSSLANISMMTNTPIINGIVVTNSQEQAEARTVGKINRGVEFAQAALEMAGVCQELQAELADIEDSLYGDAFDEMNDNDDGDTIPFDKN